MSRIVTEGRASRRSQLDSSAANIFPRNELEGLLDKTALLALVTVVPARSANALMVGGSSAIESFIGAVTRIATSSAQAALDRLKLVFQPLGLFNILADLLLDCSHLGKVLVELQKIL